MKLLKNNLCVKEISGNLLQSLQEILTRNEKVHLIKQNSELLARSSFDKRIYGLFQDKKLFYFTFVYYSSHIPSSISEILLRKGTGNRVLTFYSINKTEFGKNTQLGKELILQVQEISKKEFPLEITCTLSPIVGLENLKSGKEAQDYILKSKKGINKFVKL
jgi:hypothetical protein